MAKDHDTPGRRSAKIKQPPACQVRKIKVNHTHANQDSGAVVGSGGVCD